MATKSAARPTRGKAKKRRRRRSGPPAPRQNSLNRELWLEFLDKEMLRSGGTSHDPTLFNGRRMEESQQRSLHRWRREGSTPDIFSADAWTIYFLGQPIDVFFRYCERRSRSPWALGKAPTWYERDDWERDFESDDPKWRRDARQQHGRRRAAVAA